MNECYRLEAVSGVSIKYLRSVRGRCQLFWGRIPSLSNGELSNGLVIFTLIFFTSFLALIYSKLCY